MVFINGQCTVHNQPLANGAYITLHEVRITNKIEYASAHFYFFIISVSRIGCAGLLGEVERIIPCGYRVHTYIRDHIEIRKRRTWGFVDGSYYGCAVRL